MNQSATPILKVATPSPATAAQARAERILHGPILPTILKLTAPNLVVMLAQALANFLESYYVGLLGVAALAGAALVFPLLMLMLMMSSIARLTVLTLGGWLMSRWFPGDITALCGALVAGLVVYALINSLPWLSRRWSTDLS